MPGVTDQRVFYSPGAISGASARATAVPQSGVSATCLPTRRTGRPPAWRLPSPGQISAASFANTAVKRGRGLRYPQGRFHPHIVLRIGGDVFTSVGLPLHKGG